MDFSLNLQEKIITTEKQHDYKFATYKLSDEYLFSLCVKQAEPLEEVSILDAQKLFLQRLNDEDKNYKQAFKVAKLFSS